MTADNDAPKSEFSNFLDDIAEEISQKVESLAPPAKNAESGRRDFSADRYILDWPSVIDRMIEEIR